MLRLWDLVGWILSVFMSFGLLDGFEYQVLLVEG